MGYLALYRKYRPIVFEDVVGQEHITSTLKNQITSAHIGHAYLFCGTRGTGKTTTAKILSRSVNCLHNVNGNPCNECPACKGILDGSLLDVIEMDAASNNRVEDIRALRDEVNYLPAGLKYKVYIIDEVHMLTASAFNALLKTLEEPPSQVIFILATTESHKIPATILSRCQRFDFKRIGNGDIQGRLALIAQQEGIPITSAGLALVAKLGEGSMRDALSILERCLSMGKEQIDYADIADLVGVSDNSRLLEIMRQMGQKNIPASLSLLNELYAQGRDMQKLLADLTECAKNILICKLTPSSGEIIDASKERLEELQALSLQFSNEQLLFMMKIFSQALTDVKYEANKKMIAELAFMKIMTEYPGTLEALAVKVQRLEQMLSGGGPVSVPVPEKPKSAASEAVLAEVASAETHSAEEAASPKTESANELLSRLQTLGDKLNIIK